MRSEAEDAVVAVSDGGGPFGREEGAGEAAWCLRWLAQPGVGAATVRRLIARFGRLSRAAGETVESVADAIGCDPSRAAVLLQRVHEPDCLLAALAEIGRTREADGDHRVFGADDYPELLATSADPPALLAVRGALHAASEPTVAIVGSRRATTYGRLAAGRIAAELAERGVVIVSGGARGIDAEAHRGALRAGGRTIAVMATGFGHAYPPEHRGLYDEIAAAGGAVLTEQSHAIEARPELFPRRNRIVAGLSVVTIVIEAAARSGALLTARLAVEDDGRDVGCLPGPVDQPQSEGCHRAIREGWAHLVTGADDIVALLEAGRPLLMGARERSERRRSERGRLERCRMAAGENARRTEPCDGRTAQERGARALGRASPATRSDGTRGSPPASEDETRILALLAREPLGMDGLEAALDWPVPRIASVLLQAEMAGRVERSATGAYAPSRSGRRGAGEGRGVFTL